MSETQLQPTGRPHSAIAFLLCGGLCAVVAYCALKLLTNNEFALSGSWDELTLGLQWSRLRAGVLTLAALALFCWVSRRLLGDVNGIVWLAPLAIVVAGKAPALVSVVVFSLASAGVGRWLLQFLDSERDPGERVAFSFFLGTCVNGFLLWVALHFPINYALVYFLFFGGQVFVFRKELLSLGSDAKSAYATWRNHGGALAVALPLVFLMPYVLNGAYLHDGVYFHLYLPQYTALYGEYHFDPNIQVWSFNTTIMPMGVYTGLYLMGDEFSVRIFNHLMNMVGLAVLLHFARARYGSRVSILAALFLVTTPYLISITGFIFVDAFSLLASALVFIQALRFAISPAWRPLIHYFLLIGFGILCKQLCVVYFGSSLLVVLIGIVRSREWRFTAGIPIGVLVVASMLAPVLLYNYARTQNPIFPLANHYFESPHFAVKHFDGNKETRWNHPVDWALAHDITFSGSDFVENTDFTFGFSYFVFLLLFPALFVLPRDRRREGLLLLALFLVYIVLLRLTSGIYIRYFVGSLFIGSLLLALVADGVLQATAGRQVLPRVALAAVVCVFCLNWLVQVGGLGHQRKYPLVGAFDGVEIPNAARDAYEYASRKYGREARGLVIDSSHLYFAGFHTVGAAWYNYENFVRFGSIETADEMYDIVFDELRVDFIIMPDKSTSYPVLAEPEFRRRVEAEFSTNRYGVFRPVSG